MSTVGDHANRHPVSVLTTTRANDAAQFMAEFVIGDVLVCDPETNRVIGICTDRDLLVAVTAKNLEPNSVDVGDICSADPITVALETDLQEAIELMKVHGLRRLPVVHPDGTPAGVISVADLVDTDHVDDATFRAVVRASVARQRERRTHNAG